MLNVSECFKLSFGELSEVVSANGGSLRELRALNACLLTPGGASCFTVDHVQELLSAAPKLEVLEVHVSVLSTEDAGSALPMLLRNEPPFGPLRISRLTLLAAFDMEALAAAAPMHASLTGLRVYNVPYILNGQPWIEPLVDLVISLRLPTSYFVGFHDEFVMPPDALRSLARLLTAGSLRVLNIQGNKGLFSGAHLPAFGAALRSSRLHMLSVDSGALSGPLVGALEIISACSGHPTLKHLRIYQNEFASHDCCLAVGYALGSLLSSPASVLELLSINSCRLGDAALRPIFAALSRTRLRHFDCSFNDISAGFGRVVLSAVRDNASLRELALSQVPVVPELEQAVELVRARAAGPVL